MRRLIVALATFATVFAFVSPTQSFAAPPAAPTNVTAVSSSISGTSLTQAQAQISWTAVAGAIGYFVTAVGDGSTVTRAVPGANTNSFIFEGLTGGKSYSFTVLARNNLGEDSAASTPSVLVAQSIPNAVRALTAVVASSTTAKLTWTPLANSDNGGSTITSYSIVEKDAKIAATTISDISKSEQVVTGLQPGQAYNFSIYAVNAIGTSACALSGDLTNICNYATYTHPTVPGAPTSPSAQLSGAIVTASWSAPANVGGSPITQYCAYLIKTNASPETETSLCDPGTSVTFRNVSAGSYVIQVEATNVIGVSARSTRSTSVTVSSTVLKANNPVFTPTTFSDLTVNATLNVSAVAPSGSTVTITAIGVPTGACTFAPSGSSGSGVVTGVAVGTCQLRAEVATDNSEWDNGLTSTSIFRVVAAPAPTPPSGGGGGGGAAAPKQTALYFQVVEVDDLSKIYTKAACVEIYSRTLVPQFMGTGCSTTDGRINVLLADGKVTVRVFALGNGAVYREYLGEVANDTFTMEGATYFPGTTRFAVRLPSPIAVITPTPTPTPTPVPTPTPTPTPVPTPTPTPTPVPTPTPTPTPVPTPTPTPTPVPTPTPTPTASKSTFFSTTTSTKNVSKISVRSSTSVSTRVGRSIQLMIPTVGSKNVTLKLVVKDASGKSFQVASRVVSKNKGYTSPTLKMLKRGTLTATFTIGTQKRTVTVRVAS